jgi:signal transduction histidine kinase
MRLWPQSLFGRLVLVLMAGLTVALFISAAISLSERAQVLFNFSNLTWAQRDAQVVRLMDSLGTPDRLRIARVITTPRLLVSLSPRLQVSGPPDPESEEFRDVLQNLLGPDRQLRIVTAQRTPQEAVADVPVSGVDTTTNQRTPHVITEVQLKDGSWVNFDHPRPWSVAINPLRLLLSLSVLLCSVLLLSFFAVRKLTRPLAELARAADELGRDINRPPLPETGPTEVRGAATAFNTMQARLSNFITERTRILTAISHDLRTPITRLRLRAEMLDDEELRAKFVRDLQDMESMTNSTLDFLRGLEVHEALQTMDLMALLESLQEDAAEMGHDVRLSGAVSRAFRGRPQALRRCLDNLVNNAVRYGQRAEISVEDTESAVVIHVRDAGPGIPEGELERVFEPYYRLDSARNRQAGGNGLGLGIARNIAQLHGGSLVLRNHPAGGLEAILILPRN